MGQTQEDLKGGGEEEGQSGKGERERPFEGDDLGFGGNLLDGIELGQPGDDEESYSFGGVIAGEEREEPDGSQEEG